MTGTPSMMKRQVSLVGSQTTAQQNIDQLNRQLNEKGVKPSYQRTRIYEYLINHLTHPTVDEIYQALCDQIPTLSKTTVYNTLKAFMEANLVRMINTDGHQARFDLTLEWHGHFQCDQCGQIYDFQLSADPAENEALDGFFVRERQVNCQGVCRHCLPETANC